MGIKEEDMFIKVTDARDGVERLINFRIIDYISPDWFSDPPRAYMYIKCNGLNNEFYTVELYEDVKNALRALTLSPSKIIAKQEKQRQKRITQG